MPKANTTYCKYSSLTDKNRISEKGVPRLIDLGSGILAGSVSPHLRAKFRREDFCFLLDVPREIEKDAEVLEIMGIIAKGTNRNEIIAGLRAKYPRQVKKMIRNYIEFYRTKNSLIASFLVLHLQTKINYMFPVSLMN